ncbi:class I tRNA ligase family protein, partial [Candidatus Gracilibacteria bacterium]|nr:class I tRNA ligase family protein [Candidatus Gracilibacteria bacterium]
MEKNYSPKNFEKNISKKWEERKIFSCPKKFDSKKGTHINIMPPPNANGNLHLGHASGETIMDIAGRYAKMNGKDTFLLPGKDHAGIMTQVIYEKFLAEKGIDKEKMSRDELFEGCYKFCEENSGKMRNQ